MQLLFDNPDQHVGGNGTPDLRLHGVFAVTQKTFDSKMLLDPLDEQHDAARTGDRPALQEPLAGGIVLQVDQATFAHQKIPGHQRERREVAGLVRYCHLRAYRYRQKRTSTQCLALHLSTDFVGLDF